MLTRSGSSVCSSPPLLVWFCIAGHLTKLRIALRERKMCSELWSSSCRPGTLVARSVHDLDIRSRRSRSTMEQSSRRATSPGRFSTRMTVGFVVRTQGTRSEAYHPTTQVLRCGASSEPPHLGHPTLARIQAHIHRLWCCRKGGDPQ